MGFYVAVQSIRVCIWFSEKKTHIHDLKSHSLLLLLEKKVFLFFPLFRNYDDNEDGSYVHVCLLFSRTSFSF